MLAGRHDSTSHDRSRKRESHISTENWKQRNSRLNVQLGDILSDSTPMWHTSSARLTVLPSHTAPPTKNEHSSFKTSHWCHFYNNRDDHSNRRITLTYWGGRKVMHNFSGLINKFLKYTFGKIWVEKAYAKIQATFNFYSKFYCLPKIWISGPTSCGVV